jgi:hypothetical protein
MSSGIVYGGAANTTLVDVLTWHDLDERRVWSTHVKAREVHAG